ncbi:MAG: hypothetical protein ABIO70_19285 [Pseudomonadota bacterium]
MTKPGRAPLHGALAWRRVLAALSLVGPLSLALLLHSGATRWRPLALLLLAEPLAIALGLYLWLLALTRGRWVCALGLLFGGTTALGLLHLPPAPRGALAPDQAWVEMAGACLTQAEVPTSMVRVLTWHAGGASPSAGDIDRIAATEPDLAVLTGLPDGEALDRLVTLRAGELLTLGTRGDLTGVYVRGIFLDCRGVTAFWPWAAAGDPEPSAERARLALALPRLEGGGVLPLVAFQVPSAQADLASGAWPASLEEGVAALASIAGLGAGETIAAGHLASVAGMAPVAAALEGAGLRDAGGAPTWPARLGPLPFLPQHRLDRVLAGADWRTVGTSSVRMDNSHHALLVELEPRRQIIAPLGGE